MNEYHERRRPVRLGLPEIEDVALVRSIGNVDKIGRDGGFMLVLSLCVGNRREQKCGRNRKMTNVHKVLPPEVLLYTL
jgi:hypothetical protein